MPRREIVVDTTRKLVSGKIFDGEIYDRGDEAILPPGFPQDGPWWSDYISEEEAAELEAKGETVERYELNEPDDVELSEADAAYLRENATGPMPVTPKRVRIRNRSKHGQQGGA